MKRKSMDIRRRLTLQTVGILVLTCAAFAAFSGACYYNMIRSEFDENLERIWTMKASLFKPDPLSRARYEPPAKPMAKDSNFRPTFYELWSPEGRRIFQSESFQTLPSNDAFGDPDLNLMRAGRGSLVTVDIPGTGTFRVKSSPVKIGNEEFFFRAARESSDIGARVVCLAKTFANLLLVFCILALVAADWLIKRTFAPVEAVRRHAEKISARMLHERLPVVNPDDEIGQLSQTLNHLLDRLEGSFEEMKHFTSDASHELRTPLAAIRALGESTLARADAPVAELREAMGEILEETQRLTGLTDRLLTMARLDARLGEELSTESFDLAAQTRAIVEHLEVLAFEKNQTIEVNLPPALLARGDAVLVRQALANLIDNAIKYTPDYGTVRIRGEAVNEAIRLSVTDSGPGIAEEHHGLIFRRFYRVDSDRGRATGGYGVGLAIAKKAVELSHGSMEFASELGRGSCFTVNLQSVKTA